MKTFLTCVLAVLAASALCVEAQITRAPEKLVGCQSLAPLITKERVRGRAPSKFFSEELAAAPSDVSLRLLAIQMETSSVKQDQLALGFPNTLSGRSARLTVEAMHLYHELFYEQGLQKLNAAFSLDPCNAVALAAIAQHDQVVGLQSQASAALNLAHKIAPDYSGIAAQWAEYLPDRERLELLEHLIDSSPFLAGESERKLSKAMLLSDMHRPPGLCAQIAGGKSTSLPFFLIRQDLDVKKGFELYAVRIAVNGKLRRMLVDTSASGVMLTENGARGAGLSTNKATRFAHASEVKIGEFIFKDCDIQIIGLRDAGGSFDGVLGIDSLKSYLATLDFGGFQLSLSPLPTSPMQTAKPYLETAEYSQVERDDTGVYAVDAYRPASISNWSPFIFGEHSLVVPFSIEGGSAASGVLMTALERSMLLRSAVPPSLYLDALDYPWLPGLFVRWNPDKIDLFQAKDLKVHFAGLQLAIGRALVGTDPEKALPLGTAGFIGLDYLRHLSVTINMRDHLLKAQLSRVN